MLEFWNDGSFVWIWVMIGCGRMVGLVEKL